MSDLFDDCPDDAYMDFSMMCSGLGWLCPRCGGEVGHLDDGGEDG